ncbi:hypothetical protein B0H66DRAFT_570320 [Apodospora peruviana]|uniref:NAD-dependent epimerase/dehydratase domain-containing protein n=1 Tax=Apodospora peruviana TaxID=516989 RepID=A0AAE0HSV1_9PEZI|nr:hypothetical protein B0H66DRAFT_570320 [Apodospora peruviana]
MAAPTIPKGSLVLVTGATGFVAAHIIKAFLAHGYKVRGTVRDTTKASWLVTDVFRAYAERGDLELAVVPDLAAPHAWDEAVKGVAAIAHVASVVTLDTDPAKVIPQTVLGATSIMDAALKEPPVKEFVYTSSIVASVMQVVGLDAHVSKDSWNDAAVKMAWDPATKSGGVVYMASKVEAEKAVWKFVEEKNPHFGVNSVCPSTIMGEPLHESHLKTGSAWLKQLVDKKLDNLMWTPAREFS